MPVRWYYQNQGGAIGPVSAAELKYLINVGTIGDSTLVRTGDTGPWVTADEIGGLLAAAGESGTAEDSAAEILEWHFNLKGQSTQGQVPWGVLKAMAASGELQPDDVVWKPGMALWVRASQVPGLLDELFPTTIRAARFRETFALLNRPRVLWAGVAVTFLLGLITAAVGWNRARTESRDQPNAGVTRTGVVNEKGDRLKGGLPEVERLLDDAQTAVRVEQLDRATRLLNQYLASSVTKQFEAAKLLLREIKQAVSGAEAALVAKSLDDEALKAYLRQGVQPLVDAIETPELRPTYERTLLQAFRQESNRRQMIPRDAIAQNPNMVSADPIANDDKPEPERAAVAEPQEPPGQPKLSVLGPAGPVRRGPVGNRDLKIADPRLARRPGSIPADLDDVLARPVEFAGGLMVLNGLFKIGTKLSEVKGPDGQILGWSLPVAHNDDSIVCSGDGKVGRQKAYLLLDDKVAAYLSLVFAKLGLRPTIKPSYKCILTVTTRRLLVNGAPAPVVVISSMEVLGGCNYLSVARHQYSQAFRTLTVSPDEADVDFGDGDLWVQRLGGEENFVQPIRRKFREMQRRAITNRDSAVIDRILQRELANVVSRATAINHIVAMEGLRRMRIWP